jgi:hypothetical protein
VTVNGMRRWTVCDGGRYVTVDGMPRWTVCDGGRYVTVDDMGRKRKTMKKRTKPQFTQT